MSSDEQFTAKGPAIIGFQTNPEDPAEPIERGVDVLGTVLGVRGESPSGPGVMGKSDGDVGVHGQSSAGSGVFGIGTTGVEGQGTDGSGVKGLGLIGSSRMHPGVLGLGARRPDGDNSERRPHGPGVIGVGGGEDFANQEREIGSVGVLGVGADTQVIMKNGALHGPRVPGAGVAGHGGSGKPHDDAPRLNAPGVVGFSGRHDAGAPLGTEPGLIGDVGVFGSGAVGVRGVGRKGAGVKGEGSGGPVNVIGASDVLGPGVLGVGGARRAYRARGPLQSAAGVVGMALGEGAPEPSDSMGTGVYGTGTTGIKGVGVGGRGGVFQASKAPQVGLTPPMGPRLPQTTLHTPEIVDDPPSQGLKLPANAWRGDLMAVSEGRGRCRLWFCVQGNGSRGAQWAEVLLGPPFEGRSE